MKVRVPLHVVTGEGQVTRLERYHRTFYTWDLSAKTNLYLKIEALLF